MDACSDELVQCAGSPVDVVGKGGDGGRLTSAGRVSRCGQRASTSRSTAPRAWTGLVLLCGVTAAVGLGCRHGPVDGDEPLPPDIDLSPTEGALSSPSLTHEQEARVLKLVDDICGDTWCEGDDDFAFRKLACDSRCGTCVLGFQIFPREGSAAPRAWHSCKTSGFSGFDSLVVTAANGYQSLAPTYYDALTACISAIEAERR